MSEMTFKRLLTPTRMDEQVFFRSDYPQPIPWLQPWMYLLRLPQCVLPHGRFCHCAHEKGLLACTGTGTARQETHRRGYHGCGKRAYNYREEALGITRRALLLLRRYGFGVFAPHQERDDRAGCRYCLASLRHAVTPVWRLALPRAMRR